MTPPRISVPVLVAVLALAACGQGEPQPPTAPPGVPVTSFPQPGPTGPDGPSPAGSGSTAPGPAGPDPTTPGPAGPTTPGPSGPARNAPPSPGSPTTLSGVVREGVEPGCYLIDNYLLVGGPREVIRAGGRLTVTGRVQADLMTTCQQGVPFVVETATRG
jgi:hypothetical protein